MRKRTRITVIGRVQGVGFRPTVYRYAVELGLVGFVKNTPAGVVTEIEGNEAAVSSFIEQLRKHPPPQARIDQFLVEDMPTGHDGEFRILPSQRSGDLIVGIPPDLATCDQCVSELFNATDRRYRYPFINCTNCGPRFTIVKELPYDREKTSMAPFHLCPSCAAEFSNPADHRFDAQPNACAKCGPALRLIDVNRSAVDTADPIRETARLLKSGAIVAVKSLGGYHLCCDAKNEKAVGLLRERKGRMEKPFAVMFASLDEIRRYAEVGREEADELAASSSPVVIVKRKSDSGLSAQVAPDTADVGAFLPYTPLHHLLLAEISPLIMTSGNRTEEPIAKDDQDLGRILGPIADYALVHDREIVRRCDDSVLKIVRGKRMFFRRSRGWVPANLSLPLDGPPVLACGAELKNTFCLTRGPQAFMSQHIGDLTEYPSHSFFNEAIEDLLKLLKIRPRIIAHDMHPDYESTRFALHYPAERRVAVQHHHAHIAACMAEHQLAEPVIGVAMDGAGFGPDGTIWGGEFLVANLRDFQRVGHLKQYRMPGADEAIRHPVRMAWSCLISEFGPAADELSARFMPSLQSGSRDVLRRLVESGKHAPLTSSAGRLFDAVSALLGLCETISYEGQAAIRLQTLARKDISSSYSFEIDKKQQPFVLSFGPLFREIIRDLESGVGKQEIAGKFHRTLAVAAGEMCNAIREAHSIRKVVLSGGVFQNDLLLNLLTDELKARGFGVYSHERVPPNDGGLALGQAVVALANSKDQD